MSACHAGGGVRRYSHHKDPAIRLLNSLIESFPKENRQKGGEGILVCAMLYLEGDLRPGHSVERWWNEQDAALSNSTAPPLQHRPTLKDLAESARSKF